MRACLASGGYTGWTLRIRLAACTWPPTRIRVGVASLFFTGGGGAAVGTAPIIPPITPPGVPPGTPPGTPPTTLPVEGGGSSSSLIFAISFGIDLGAISLPASNWRGITLTILGGAGGGGGGGMRHFQRQVESGELLAELTGEVLQRDLIEVVLDESFGEGGLLHQH